MSTIKANNIEEATSGGGTYFLTRAWVNYNNDSTIFIRDSGNVSSISDNGTGKTVVTLSNAMPDVNGHLQFGGSEVDINGAQFFMSQILTTSTQEYQSDAQTGSPDNISNNYVIVGY